MSKPVVHFEIGCKDLGAVSGFYSKLFGWEMNQLGPAAIIKSDTGIGGHLTALGHEPHNYVTVYVEVDDLAAYLKHAEELGGSTVVAPTTIPGSGSFAWMKDPEGNLIGLWKNP